MNPEGKIYTSSCEETVENTSLGVVNGKRVPFVWNVSKLEGNFLWSTGNV